MFEEYEQSYCSFKGQLESRRRALLPTSPQTNSTFFHDAGGENRAIVVQALAPSISKADLPVFSGVQADWESFKTRLNAKVGTVPTIPPVDKLKLLMASVLGEAESCVQNYEINEANFAVAWRALKARYDNKRLRLSALLNELINMQRGSNKSATAIRRLIDDAKELITALALLDRPVNNWHD